MRRVTLAVILFSASPALAQPSQDEIPAVMFHSQTRLVLLSFHVTHGKNYVADLKQSDIVLLEDGKPRQFSIFDSPATLGRMPLELVLLFDINPRIEYFWDPAAVYRFIPQWNQELTQAILEKEAADIRVSVYSCFGQKLYKLCPAGTDARRVTAAIRGLLTPRPTLEGIQAFSLSMPPKRDAVGRGPFTNDYPTSYFVSAEHRGWPMEAAIGTLNDVAAAQDKVARVFVMFSEGIGATTTVPEDVGNEALDLGIPIYPVATNYLGHIEPQYPRNLFRMREFEALGKMTGGRSVEYTSIDAAALERILENVKNDGLSQYIVGFVPSSEGAAQEHRLEVKLVSKSSGSLDGGKRRATY